MARNSFISLGKLSDVKGRIHYISSREKQENLYATYNTATPDFWRKLARTNQSEFKKSGTKGKCVEARELIIALPECFTELDKKALLQQFTDYFKITYGMECISALHHNKSKTNYHIHLIFSERKLLSSPIVKVATRNMFYNETGKHVRTRNEIMDEVGNVRAGCKIISKGEVYERQLFEKKESIFKDYHWLEDIKRQYTDLINENLRKFSQSEELMIFDSNGPYMPMQKIGKNNPLASEIEKSNQLCKEWNQLIDEVLAEEVVEKDELSVYKYRQINEVLEGEVKTHGWNKSIFPDVLQGATRKLYELLLIVKEYHQVHCVKSFSIPDETLAEIKQKKASKFHKMDWRQATPRKQRYIPYKKMTPYQKWEFQKMQEHKRLYGEKSLIDRGNRKR